ncbi:MAG: hypothetical protein ACKPJD_09355, partial [Planctomycetaceae bacterium]
ASYRLHSSAFSFAASRETKTVCNGPLRRQFRGTTLSQTGNDPVSGLPEQQRDARQPAREAAD